MRFGILTQYYPPEIGAPQARLAELAKRFVERGHQVYVITAMPSYPQGRIHAGYGGWYRKERLEGSTVFRTWIYPTKSVATARRMANYGSFLASSLVSGAARLPAAIDYLLTESPPLFLGITGYLLSRLRGARWIFNVSDLWPETAVRLGMVREGWSLRAATRLEAFCYRKAWLVTGQSKEILDNIRQRFPGVPLYHLSNGVDTGRFRPEHRSEEIRGRLADGRPCVAIYAGLHGVAQGLEQILEAAALLRDVDTLRIVLVGDGPHKEKLVAQARALGLEDSVRFVEPYSRDAMPAVMSSADIAIVPLKTWIPGAVPSKLYEAMGAGLPVVLVADGEAVGIVERSQAGIVVSPGDIAGLSAALRHLAVHPGERQQFGQRGRAAAEVSFNRRVIADAFIDHLEKSL